jgi:hypothetical protein
MGTVKLDLDVQTSPLKIFKKGASQQSLNYFYRLAQASAASQKTLSRIDSRLSQLRLPKRPQ